MYDDAREPEPPLELLDRGSATGSPPLTRTRSDERSTRGRDPPAGSPAAGEVGRGRPSCRRPRRSSSATRGIVRIAGCDDVAASAAVHGAMTKRTSPRSCQGGTQLTSTSSVDDAAAGVAGAGRPGRCDGGSSTRARLARGAGGQLQEGQVLAADLAPVSARVRRGASRGRGLRRPRAPARSARSRARASRRACGLNAHGTAPSSCIAQKTSTKPRPAGSTTATRSPGPTPSACSPAASCGWRRELGVGERPLRVGERQPVRGRVDPRGEDSCRLDVSADATGRDPSRRPTGAARGTPGPPAESRSRPPAAWCHSG